MISTDVMHRPRQKYRHRCFIKRELQVIAHEHMLSHQCYTHTCPSCHPTLLFLFCYNTIQDTPIRHNIKTNNIILCRCSLCPLNSSDPSRRGVHKTSEDLCPVDQIKRWSLYGSNTSRRCLIRLRYREFRGHVNTPMSCPFLNHF